MAPSPSSGLVTQAGSDSLLFQLSAVLLLLSGLGPLLVAKIVLGFLLALGPFFLVLLLFDVTRGLFEGWLRASIAVALTPLLAILSLTLVLTLLKPSLAAIELMRDRNIYTPGVALGVFIICALTAAGASAVLIACGWTALAFNLSGRAPVATTVTRAGPSRAVATAAASAPSRASRLTMATAAQTRRDAELPVETPGLIGAVLDRRAQASAPQEERTRVAVAPSVRLSQAPRRTPQPQPLRSGPGGRRDR